MSQRVRLQTEVDAEENATAGELAQSVLTGATLAHQWAEWIGDKANAIDQTRAGTYATRNVARTLVRKVAALEAKLELLRYATRVRPDYPFHCQRCGASHTHDTSIPSEVWNEAIRERHKEYDGMLCTLCIDELVAAAGLTCEAEFYFSGQAVKSRLYADDMGTVAMLERNVSGLQAELAVKQGAIELLAWQGAESPAEEWANPLGPRRMGLLDALRGLPHRQQDGQFGTWWTGYTQGYNLGKALSTPHATQAVERVRLLERLRGSVKAMQAEAPCPYYRDNVALRDETRWMMTVDLILAALDGDTKPLVALDQATEEVKA